MPSMSHGALTGLPKTFDSLGQCTFDLLLALDSGSASVKLDALVDLPIISAFKKNFF